MQIAEIHFPQMGKKYIFPQMARKYIFPQMAQIWSRSPQMNTMAGDPCNYAKSA